MSDETRYDAVQYPSGLFETTHPSHLAAMLRLHGLSAPDPATARVLEIAGGDGFNLIAMAAASPEAHFVNFDLSAAAVARGAQLAEAAGLANMRNEVADVIVAAEAMEGEFDYIIIHGLYAWVPEAVREAALRLAGRLLSAEGVMMLSYNCTPGGHLRRAIRDMLLHEVEAIGDPGARVGRAIELLTDFVRPREGDRPILAGMREVAEPMMRKNFGSLYHDELSDCYAPQALKDVVAAVAPHGLTFLNDAVPAMVYDGLPGNEMSDAEVVHAAQASDYQVLAFFHQSLFVRPGRAPLRRVDPACFDGLLAASRVRRTGPEQFSLGDKSLEIEDARLGDFLEALGAAWPLRLSLAPFSDSPEHCEALIQLFQRGMIELHAAPYPGTLTPGERPEASGLARTQIALGSPVVCTLAHQMVGLSDEGARAFVALLDGTRDRAALEAEWARSPFAATVSVESALPQLARAGLLVG